MATHGWGKDSPVDEWLFAEGYRFDFFQAVNLLEMAHSQEVSVGEGAEPEKEAVRFKSAVGLDFPASDIVEVNPPVEADKPADMIVNFMGLAGVLGPLYTASTELILERVSQKDTAFRDFLDIFNHRLVSIFYRIRKMHRLGLEFKDPGHDRFSNYLYSILGLGTHGLQGRMQVRDRALLHYAGLIGQQPRSMIGLELILTNYFQVKVEGHQFLGQWYDLEQSQRTTIGTGGQNQRLGLDPVVIGTRIWNQQGKFEIVLGPLTLQQFLDFLPIGWGFGPLCELTRFYTGDEYDFSFRLVLKADEIPVSRLSTTDGPRLGWTSWLKTGEWQEDDSQVEINPHFLRSGSKAIRIPLFFSLPPEKLSELVGRMTARKYQKNMVVMRQGDHGDSMFAIRSGTVSVIRRDEDGREVLLNFLEEGDCFGEMALISGKVRSATVVTQTDCELLELKKKDLDDFMIKYPRLRRALRAYYQNRIVKHKD
jgi:type VI secretion system protein ImpH